MIILSPELIRIWEAAIPKVLADPEFRKVYEAEALIPSFIPHSQYGAFTERFAQNAAAFLREHPDVSEKIVQSIQSELGEGMIASARLLPTVALAENGASDKEEAKAAVEEVSAKS